MKYFVAFLVIAAVVLLAHGTPVDTPDASKLSSTATGGVELAAGLAGGAGKQAEGLAKGVESKASGSLSSVVNEFGKAGKNIIDGFTNLFQK